VKIIELTQTMANGMPVMTVTRPDRVSTFGRAFESSDV
jgi:hypothetical protein